MDTLAGHMKNKYVNSSSPILKSIDPNINSMENVAAGDRPASNISYPELSSLNLCDDVECQGSKSILLLDDRERLRVGSVDSFLKLLKIPANKKVKVVSIFGNTGEGKSYTMNHVFFDGDQVFRTSSSQFSCTLGVWAMYDPKSNVVCLDTEGLLGISKKEHQRTRLLLKVLAVSDVIIFRTRAERLQRDMYSFLGGSSKAYKDHFSHALKKALAKTESDRMVNGLGPGVIIFHETHHTDTLHDSASVTQSVEDILQTTFSELNLSYDAFSFIKYVGIKTGDSTTSFKELKLVLTEKLESTDVRSPRDPKYIYLTLKSLNEKFQNTLSDATPQLYLPAFFTCPISASRVCYKNGNKVIVKPSYQTTTDNSWSSYLSFVWSGYVIECPNCGEI
ncbi:hypothetical protein NQ318_013639 [Aromia moschata]|uniref:Guanylate-binding protein N-terminal domain-containing protein n=1 Tax=Aromia moschata TaxID=1265417 RepID=A0AAV8XII4_9CUCU|nr:hypothetical protein NQ318_013639 [Aromia moschata]